MKGYFCPALNIKPLVFDNVMISADKNTNICKDKWKIYNYFFPRQFQVDKIKLTDAYTTLH